MPVFYTILICIFLFYLFRRRRFLSVIISALLLGFIAFFITDEGQVDYIIHKSVFDHIKYGGFSSISEHYYFLTSPLYLYYVYLVTFFEDNRMLSVINTFLCYLIIFYTMYLTYKREAVAKTYTSCFIYLICLLPWVDFALGIRGGFAFSLCSLALLYDSSENKKYVVSLFLFIFPIFIHQSCFAILLLRLIAEALKYFPRLRWYANILVLFMGVLSSTMSKWGESLGAIPGFEIIAVVSHSLNSYAVEQDGGAGEYGNGIAVIRGLGILIPFLLFINKKYHIKEDRYLDSTQWNVPITTYTLLMFFTIGFIWQFDMFARYSVACLMLVPFVFIRLKKVPCAVILFALLALLYNAWNNYSYVIFHF